MNNILDQISIPSLSSDLSELACTLVEKHRQCIWKSVVQFLRWAICRNYSIDWDTKANYFFFLLCGALILSPFLGTPENAGVTQQFRPLLGPQEGRGYAATESGILKKGMVQPGWGATAKVPLNTITTRIGDLEKHPIAPSKFKGVGWISRNLRFLDPKFFAQFFLYPPPPQGTPEKNATVEFFFCRPLGKYLTHSPLQRAFKTFSHYSVEHFWTLPAKLCW